MTISNTAPRRPGMALRALVLLAMSGALPALAQEATPPPSTDSDMSALQSDSVVTPAAQAVLDRMTATLKSLNSVAVTAHVTRDEVLAFGYKLQHNETARMWVERPNRMRVELEGDVKDRTYIYDGSSLTMYAPDLNVYASSPAPGTLGEVVKTLLDAGVEMPLIDLLYHGNAGDLTEDVRVGLVVGDSQVEGVATDHLAFRQPLVDWQLWVEKGSRALPRKLLITTRYEVGDPQYQAILTWDANAKAKSDAFTFSPPAGAKKIEFHTPLVASGEAK